MKVVDKHGSWFTNFSQFRMHDPMSDTYFEPGDPTKATNTAWRENNKLTVKATDEEGTLVDDPDPMTGSFSGEIEGIEGALPVADPGKATKK